MRGARWRAWVAVGVGIGLLGVATAGMVSGVEPFATWYYLFAWFGTLLGAEGTYAWLGARSGGADRGFLVLGRPAHLLTLAGWSAVAWLFYELLNFRLQNWYYVFLPHDRALRWGGAILAFSTVFPAVFLAEALLDRLGVARAARWPRLLVSARGLTALRIAGAAMMVLVLVWPRWFFPLVWGATTLLVEPAVYQRARDRSLLHDLERGEPGRILRLLLGGAAIGLLWELFNIGARAKWIYTVPGLEELKLFEMPVLGFLGFPPFALECFVLWQALVLAGLAVPRTGRAPAASIRRRVAAAAFAPVFSLLVLAGMDRRTISSFAPRLDELPAVPAAAVAGAGLGPFSLAAADAPSVARRAGVSAEEAWRWIQTARLATLRGIGTRHVTHLHELGIVTVQQLARVDAADLVSRLEALTGEAVVPARVRVWVRGARAQLRAMSEAAP